MPGECKGVKTQIYVDDATMIMWAKQSLYGRPELANIAYETAREWADMVVDILRFQTSTKNRFLPPGPAADVAPHGCQVQDCTAKIATHGVGLGVDTVVGPKGLKPTSSLGPSTPSCVRSGTTSSCKPSAARGRDSHTYVRPN